MTDAYDFWPRLGRVAVFLITVVTAVLLPVLALLRWLPVF